MTENSEISGKTSVKDHIGKPIPTILGNHSAGLKYYGVTFHGSKCKWSVQVITYTGCGPSHFENRNLDYLHINNNSGQKGAKCELLFGAENGNSLT